MMEKTLAINIGQKSIQSTCVYHSGTTSLKVQGLEHYQKISFNNEKSLKRFLLDLRNLCFLNHVNQIIVSNLGPYSTYSQGLVHGFLYSFLENNSRVVKLNIYRKEDVIASMEIDRYSEYFRHLHDSLTTEEVDNYLNSHPLLEKISYVNPPNRGTRYSDVLAFYYLTEHLQND